MNKNIALSAVVIAATILTTACGTTTEPVAAPSSSAVPSAGSAVQEYLKVKSEEAKHEMRLHVAATLPHDVDRGYAEAASKDGVPFAFTYGGKGCTWVRLPDKTLWPLHGDGGPLTRDVVAEKAFGSWPGAGASDGHPCQPASGIPAADDRSASGPYRWVDERGFQRLRVNGAVYAVPAEIPATGTPLREAVIHRPAPTHGEVVPGVPSTNPN